MKTNESLNEKVTRYFLNNSRITALALIVVSLFGVIAYFTSNITGFPGAKINIVIVNTLYLGASANSVQEKVTKPIENSIKSIDGIESYTSNSRNSVSTVSITLASGVNVDTANAKIDSAVKSVALPDGAKEPTVFLPKISGQDFYYAIALKDSVSDSELYNFTNSLKTEVEKNTKVSSFTLVNPESKKVVITLDEEKLAAKKLTDLDVENSIKTWGFSIPATSNEQIAGKTQNLVLSISGTSLEELKNLNISSVASPIPTRLSDLAAVEEKVFKEADITDSVGYEKDGSKQVQKSIKFAIDARDGVDLTKYQPELDIILDKYFVTQEGLNDELKSVSKKVELVEIYNTATDNAEQVLEVQEGLFGLKLDMPKGLEFFGYAGFLLGGIQLVFFMMLLLVSWRSAIIAALAIPLSFAFSLIAVKVTGNDLNTLVIFSLVLVIGLVVDPALVLLEAIQRQIDNGHGGKDAVLRAVREIGSGLFLAVLTSMLVFVPFGVVSGFFGEIISYIPLTIIPALIGSYIVPLVFLSWLSSKFLKRNKKASDNEEENLWGAAKWMVKYTKWILTPNWKHILLRIVIIIFSIAIPLGIAGFYFGTGKVEVVQFAQPEDTRLLLASSTNFSQQLPSRYEEIDSEIVKILNENQSVKAVSSLSTPGSKSQSYYITLKDRKDRDGNKTGKEIAKDLDKSVTDKVGANVFNIDVGVIGAGPGGSSFPIAIAIKNVDAETQKKIAFDVSEILNKVCAKSKTEFEIKSDCDSSQKAILKVDNGYESTEVSFVEILLDREKLARNPVNPIAVQQIIANLYKINEGNKIGTLTQNDVDYEIVLDKNLSGPKTLEEIKNIPVTTLDGRRITLGTIANVQEVKTLESLRRVKGENVGVVNAKPNDDYFGQQSVGSIQNVVIKEFNDNYKKNYSNDVVVEVYSEGASASITKSFSELGIALLLAIILTYLVLVVFFNSFLQPIVILFAIPLTFIGIFPALSAFAGGQLGFLEIIGVIILVGIVENVAIFLIDAANQKVREGWNDRDAIAHAAGVRFRPIILTKLTTLVSTLPLAILSDFYRSLSVVIIFGLLTSGIVSLFTSPILYIAFRRVSEGLRKLVVRS